MKQADIKDRGRYVAKIDGKKTIVTAYLTPSGFRFRNEQTSFFCKCSARKCWRPAHDFETWDSRTVQEPTYKEHVWCWFEGRLYIPVVDIVEEKTPSSVEVEPGVCEWLYQESLKQAELTWC